MNTDVPFTKSEPVRDWAAIRGELSVYLLTIVTGAFAFAAWEDAQLRKEEIAVVKRIHVQLDAYSYITRDALARLEGQPPVVKSPPLDPDK